MQALFRKTILEHPRLLVHAACDPPPAFLARGRDDNEAHDTEEVVAERRGESAQSITEALANDLKRKRERVEEFERGIENALGLSQDGGDNTKKAKLEEGGRVTSGGARSAVSAESLVAEDGEKGVGLSLLADYGGDSDSE
tara:strand:- start:469 stop:891 length:423 start_codon:yes stop_codon:yes gene_type:complete